MATDRRTRKKSRRQRRVYLKPIKLEKGTLPGYSLSKSIKDRRRALEKALKKNGYLPVMRKVNALATLLKNTSPVKSKRAKRDKNWIMKNYKGKIPNETGYHKRLVENKKYKR